MRKVSLAILFTLFALTAQAQQKANVVTVRQFLRLALRAQQGNQVLPGAGSGLGNVVLSGTPTVGQIIIATGPTAAHWADNGAGGSCGTLAAGGVVFGLTTTTCSVDGNFVWDNTAKRLRTGPDESTLDPDIQDFYGTSPYLATSSAYQNGLVIESQSTTDANGLAAVALAQATAGDNDYTSVAVGAFAETDSGTHNTQGVIGGSFSAGHEGSGTLAAAVGIQIPQNANGGGGTITNNYGLQILDQTVGSNNWAIKTGAGLNEFGDAIQADNLTASECVGTDSNKKLVSGINCAGAGLPQFASYVISTDGTTISALNQVTGTTAYSSTDAGTLMRSVIAANSSTCGTILVKNGVYPINTLVQETTGGFSNFYAIGIPGTSGSNQYCQWRIGGESNSPIIDQFGTPVQTAGVIFYVTPTAVASVGGSAEITGIWVRPDVANGVGASVYLQDLDVRIPSNQRGNETAIDLSQALNTNVINVSADTNVAQASLQFPVTETIGITTTGAQKGENYFSNVYAVGYDRSIDVESEHTILDNVFGLNCNLGILYGVEGDKAIYPPSSFRNVGSVSCARGLLLGANLQVGTLLDISGLYFEDAASGIFAPVYHAAETNAGNSFGNITVTRVVEGTGIVALDNPFDGGNGGGFFMNSYGALSFQNNALTLKGLQVGGNPDFFVNNSGGNSSSASAFIAYSLDGSATSGGFGLFGTANGSPYVGSGLVGANNATIPDVFMLARGTGGRALIYTGGGTLAATFDASQKLTVAGALAATLPNSATGDYVCYNAGAFEFDASTCTLSLRKYKQNILPLTKSLAEVMKLKPVEYRYKPELNLGTKLQVGLIADEVIKVDPRIGAYSDKGELESVDYEHMTAVLVKAIQEQQHEIDSLKRQVKALRKVTSATITGVTVQ